MAVQSIDLDFRPSTPAELKACLADPMWRLCSGFLYRIMVKKPDEEDASVVPFRPNRAQRRLMGRLWHRNVILKARQLGFTTLIAIMWLDHALFNADQRCGIIAQDREAAEVIFRDKVKLAYERLTTDTQGMSPEEAALTAELDGDGLPAELPSEVANRESLQKPAGEDGDGSDPAEAPAPAPAPAPAAPAPAPAAPAPAPAPAAPSPAPAPAPAAEATPDDDAPEPAPYAIDVPADAEEQLKTLKAEHDAAFKDLMAGDMTEEAYRAIRDRTEAARETLKDTMLKATVLSEMNQQQAATDWKRAQAAEFTTFKSEGLDYSGKPALLAAYNVNLKALAAVPENENKSARWFLREAHRLTKADLGITGAAPAPAPAAPAPAPAARGVDRSQIPPTLARTPPAVDPTVAGDEFAHMANLSGAEAERAYAAMTPEQQERYLDS